MSLEEMQAAVNGGPPLTLEAPNGYFISLSEGRIEVLKESVVASVVIESFHGVPIIQELEGTGDPYAMKILAAMIKGIMNGQKFYGGVFTDNPNKDKLIKQYKRIMNARELCVLMEVN